MKKYAIALSFIALICTLLVSCQSAEGLMSDKEYYFCHNGHRIAVGGDADGLVESIGEANRVSRTTSCAGEGEDELYIYSGFRIFAHRDKEKCTVVAIELTNDAVSTPEGIRIGDKVERVKERYGEAKEKNGFLEYESKGCRLRFYLREGRVSGVKYLKNDG